MWLPWPVNGYRYSLKFFDIPINSGIFIVSGYQVYLLMKCGPPLVQKWIQFSFLDSQDFYYEIQLKVCPVIIFPLMNIVNGRFLRNKHNISRRYNKLIAVALNHNILKMREKVAGVLDFGFFAWKFLIFIPVLNIWGFLTNWAKPLNLLIGV